jgi:hypothetical protein
MLFCQVKSKHDISTEPTYDVTTPSRIQACDALIVEPINMIDIFNNERTIKTTK